MILLAKEAVDGEGIGADWLLRSSGCFCGGFF